MELLHNIYRGRAITMDCHHYITDLPERKRGQHLQREERGAIQALKRQGLSNRAIARESAPFPETAQTAFLRSIRILGCCSGQMAQVVCDLSGDRGYEWSAGKQFVRFPGTEAIGTVYSFTVLGTVARSATLARLTGRCATPQFVPDRGRRTA